jgi:hypothetical protein
MQEVDSSDHGSNADLASPCFITHFAKRRRRHDDHTKAKKFDLIAGAFAKAKLPNSEQQAFWKHVQAAHPSPACMDHASVEAAAKSYSAQPRPSGAARDRRQFLGDQMKAGATLEQATREWSQQPQVMLRKRLREEAGKRRQLLVAEAAQRRCQHRRGRGRGRGQGRAQTLEEAESSSAESSSSDLPSSQPPSSRGSDQEVASSCKCVV